MVSTLSVELPPSPNKLFVLDVAVVSVNDKNAPSEAFIRWPYKPVVLKYSFNIYLAKERKMVFYYTNCITNLNPEYK